eukprot:TRINITY_DN2977_c0_g1_i1.p1 TRINITY_DN2977_c0_g1~~TRINITY_DN2977_c0_g1_i1.p1  ORF type:complete len:186 (+),score=32.88 TRINITY_DN2977_c0_g1_i1:220-777(+)
MGKYIECRDFHQWERSCNMMAWGMFRGTFKGGLKLYTPMYFIPALVFQRRAWKHLFTKIPIEILRSSTFLASFPSIYSLFYCSLKKLFKSNNDWIEIVAGLISAMIAINIERRNRRTELALYTANQGVEVLWRLGVSKGVVRNIPHGEVLLFMIGSSLLMYFYQHDDRSLRPNVRSLFSRLLGVN